MTDKGTRLDELAAIALWATSADDGRTGRTGSGRANMDRVVAAIGSALERSGAAERARLRHRLGHVTIQAGEIRGRALACFEAMLADAGLAGDQRLQALAWCGFARARSAVGEREESLRSAREAARLAREVGDRRALALALRAQLQVLLDQGRENETGSLFRQLEGLGVALGDDRLALAARIRVAPTRRRSDAPAAIACYEAAIARAGSTGDAATGTLGRDGLAGWRFLAGELREAIRLQEECLRAALARGSRHLAGRARIAIAWARVRLGDPAAARALVDRLAVGDLEGDVRSALDLAWVLVRAGEVPRAAEVHRQAIERTLDDPEQAEAVFAERAFELAGPWSDDADTSDSELQALAGG